MLFNKRLLQRDTEKFNFPQDTELEKIKGIIKAWQKSLRNSDLEKTKEKTVQGLFLERFFNSILSYSTQADGLDNWEIIQHPSTDVDSTEPDGVLGFFSKDKPKNIVRAVIELKDAKTNLDKKQLNRKEKYTPVEQAFGYVTKYDNCDWVIVSNFREIRLYHKSRGQGYYEKFDILELDDDKEFKRFYFLLCKENLLDKNRNSLLDKLVLDTSKNEEEISKAFYKELKQIRNEIFEHIFQNNSDIDKKILLEKTQKLIDRLIFIMFCEDTGSLLPTNIIKTVYELGIKSRERSEQRVWREFKNLFQDINEGRYDIDPPINAYNGGLFTYDEILDNLVIKDPIWSRIEYLSSKYDFDSDLNVNVLGHIFEQSLNDLEQFKNEIEGIPTDKTKSKRKKDGIYYTPEYITRYIVEQTVGKYLEENPDKLETIKILDPACGSGAFLNQAHSFLKEQHKIRFEEQIKDKKQLGIYDFNPAEVDKSILLNNLYGVDLNEESVEITKLALWLKTAKKTEPLQNLDKNIKCGNSLIDDPKVAGTKAFNWKKEFPDIFKEKELQAFHVTWATHNSRYSERMKEYKVKTGEPVMFNEQDEILVTQFIAQIVKEDNLRILAYNICQDHVHCVLVCEEAERDSIVQKLKAVSARKYNIHMGRTIPEQGSMLPCQRGKTQNHLWTQKYNYNLIENETELENVLHYVTYNREKHNLPNNGASYYNNGACHYNKGACSLAKKECSLAKENSLVKEGSLASLVQSMLIPVDKAFEPEPAGGFDVVIGNPPYVRQELISGIKPYLEKNYKVYTGVSDLYVYFFERGLELLKDGGYFAFIVSNKFIKSNYGKKLTQYLQKKYAIVEIIDFGDLQIFEGATTMPCIITIKNEKPKEKQTFNYIQLETLENITDLKTEILKNGFECSIKTDCENWILTSNKKNNLLEKIKNNGIPLAKLGLNINRGIITGFNEAFIIDTETKEKLCKEDSKNEEIIKPLLRGRDILPYGYNWDNLWLINTHNGYKNIASINVEKNYPYIFKHLLNYQANLEKRYDKGKHWSNLRNCAFIEEFEKPKIIYPNMTSVFPFVFDDKGFYINDKSCIITLNEKKSLFLKFLTAYFNSRLSKFLLKIFFPVLLGGTREIKEFVFKDFPIPQATESQQNSLAQKAEKMIELNKALHEQTASAVEFLKIKYSIQKISQKLEKFYQLGANIFIEELKKLKVKLTLKEEEELINWFKEKQTQLAEIEKRINALDKEIDNEVYKLYDLTEEEINLIEKESC